MRHLFKVNPVRKLEWGFKSHPRDIFFTPPTGRSFLSNGVKHKNNLYFHRGFFTILSLVISLVILMILSYYLINTYSKAPAEKIGISQTLKHGDINSKNYRSIIDSTFKNISDLEGKQKKIIDEGFRY